MSALKLNVTVIAPAVWLYDDDAPSDQPYWLSRGAHRSPAGGRCAMEWINHITGEPHSDNPASVDPVLRHFVVCLNDAMPAAVRQRLRPYLARMIGTADDGHQPDRLRILLTPSEYGPNNIHAFHTLMASGYALLTTIRANVNNPNPDAWDWAFDMLERLLPGEIIEMPEPIRARALAVCAA